MKGTSSDTELLGETRGVICIFRAHVIECFGMVSERYWVLENVFDCGLGESSFQF